MFHNHCYSITLQTFCTNMFSGWDDAIWEVVSVIKEIPLTLSVIMQSSAELLLRQAQTGCVCASVWCLQTEIRCFTKWTMLVWVIKHLKSVVIQIKLQPSTFKPFKVHKFEDSLYCKRGRENTGVSLYKNRQHCW